MTDVKITHIEDEPSAVDPLQISITPGNDPHIGQRVFGFKDGAGNARKCLNKSAHAPVKSLNVSDFTAAGILRTDSSGDIYGDVNSLGDLNTALGGTTIDESTDPRDPNAHEIGGADHTASTLAEFNTKISDANLDDSGDPRNPTQHAIGGTTYHSSSTIAQVNALISDANVDDENDPRPPTSHAGSHESGGSDPVDHDAMTLNVSPTYKHVDSTPGVGDIGTQVMESGFIATSTKKLDVSPRNSKVIASGSTFASTDISDIGSFMTASEKYIFLTDSADVLLARIDRRTLQTLQTTASMDNRAMVVKKGYLFQFDGTLVRRYNADDLTDRDDLTATGLGNGVGAAWSETDDLFYVIDSASNLQTVEEGVSTCTVATIASLSGDFSGGPRDMCMSSDEHVLVLEGAFSSGNLYIRKYSKAGVLKYSSSAIPTTLGLSGSICCCNGTIVVTNDTKVTIVTDSGSAFSVVGSFDSETTMAKAAFFDGIIYPISQSATLFQIFSQNTPGVAVELPTHFDMTNVVGSAIQYPSISGYTDSIQDHARASIAVETLDQKRKGFNVLDVVTYATLPASPEVGDAYLISDSTPYNNRVAEYRKTGWVWYHNYVGDLVFDIDTGDRLEWSGSAWVPKNMLTDAEYAELHSAVTVADTSEIDMSITGQQISATLVASSIDETKLDASVNASLDLADSAVQRSTVRSSATTTEIVTSDENDVVRITSARTSDIAITINSAVLAIEGFRFTISVDYNASYVAYIGTAPPSGPGWSMNGNSTSSVAQNFEFTIVNGVAVPTVAPTAYYVPA